MKSPWWLAVVWVCAIPFPPMCKAQEAPRVVHVIVALADNEHQGIVPVPKALGMAMIRPGICIGARRTACGRISGTATSGKRFRPCRDRQRRFWSGRSFISLRGVSF